MNEICKHSEWTDKETQKWMNRVIGPKNLLMKWEKSVKILTMKTILAHLSICLNYSQTTEGHFRTTFLKCCFALFKQLKRN